MLLDRIEHEPSVAAEIDLNRNEVIDPRDPSYRGAFEKLQGNILKPHRREHMDLLLLHFTASAEKVREWVRSYSYQWVTSAGEQLDGCGNSGLFGGFYLTAHGYEALGFSRSEIEERFGHQDRIARFAAGMAAARQDLNDIDASEWEEPYREPRAAPIHAMALLAADNRDHLSSARDRVEQSLAGVGAVLRRETGAVLYHGNERTEPFGFVDGRSQPVFFKKEMTEEKRAGLDLWNPVAPLGLVLVPDPFANEADSLGSYLVFRKLRQDVEGFQQRIRDLAARFTGGDEKMAEALVVGRFKNGTPLEVHGQEKTGPERNVNNFDYSNDPEGMRCPLHAHVRRANPRTEAAKPHRVVRRGMPYRADNGEQGTLFLCFQSKIHDQFAYIQRTWANVNFPWTGAGVDPLIGRPAYQQQTKQKWQTGWGLRPVEWFDFSGLVTLRGGDFFFAPSLAFLRGL